VANPDASHDPIASPESPFLGDFVLSGGLSACAPLSAYAGYFYSNNTAIIAESPNTAILIRGNATITGNLNVQGSANITGSSGNGSPVSVTLPSLSACSNAINIQNKYGVGLNIDNDTIKIINNALTVDTSRIPNSGNNNIPATTYNFSNGLVSQPTGSNSISVSAVLDNTSVRLTNGKISTNTYSFINGLSGFSVTSGVSSIGLKIDNSTIKLNGNGVLYSGFTASSGVAINNNSVYLNLDNKTICLNNFQQLTTGLKFPSIGGLALNNSTQEVSIQPDNITTRINSNNGKLQAFGFVSLGDVTPQAITSNLTTYGTLSATRGVTFSDGSTLTSVKNFKPTISKLANLKQNYYDGIVTTSDGRLVVWGSNDHFSAGGAGSCWPPQTLKFAGDYVLRNNLTITKVVHGLYVTAALLSDGTMWVSGYNNWGTSGSNSYGQLGVRKDSSGNVGYREFALQRVVGWPSGTPFITDFDVASSFSAGYVHLAAIDSSGQLYLWGFNLNGALGIGTTTQGIFNPTIASAPSGAFSSGVKQVALFMYGNSYANTLVLTNDGRVYAAGYQDYGQFGNGQAATLYSSFTQCFRAVGQPVANIAKIISSSGASFQTHFLLDTSGNVWAAGLNNQGQLADNTLTQSNYFKIIPGLTTVKDMGVSGASTYASMCAITANGNVYTWGYNGYGQLGTGDTTYRAAITQIPALNGLGSKVVSTSSDSGSTVIGVIGTDKFLYVAGHYAWGQYDTYSSVQSTFASLPLANVAEAEISSNRSTAIGMIIRDTYNRVFVVCSYNSDYFSGPNNSYARQPWEITNNLV
jgi:alpha-tubulin suppressor-like RCC1 family protein